MDKPEPFDALVSVINCIITRFSLISLPLKRYFSRSGNAYLSVVVKNVVELLRQFELF